MTQQQASGWIAQITNQGLIISANEILLDVSRDIPRPAGAGVVC
ncbi:hypothetical protein ACVXHB_12165 [Escherichia coli]